MLDQITFPSPKISTFILYRTLLIVSFIAGVFIFAIDNPVYGQDEDKPRCEIDATNFPPTLFITLIDGDESDTGISAHAVSEFDGLKLVNSSEGDESMNEVHDPPVDFESFTLEKTEEHGSIVLQVFDEAGNKTVCDPVFTKLSSELPNSFSLSQNYPNPVSSTTTIPFKVAEQRHVTLTVHDILGREITTLVDRRVQPGSYEVQWDASGLSSGQYIYQLKAGTYTKSRGMTLVK